MRAAYACCSTWPARSETRRVTLPGAGVRSAERVLNMSMTTTACFVVGTDGVA
ncbi:hypothetical protein HBB16_11845 [Pseudonocardia sp. MCCB 268]|nr:hypothetical protein [Pseudonocardia cytotoxica]